MFTRNHPGSAASAARPFGTASLATASFARTLTAAALAAVAALTLAGCSSTSSLEGSSNSQGSTATEINVGSANFPEANIIAQIYGQALAANGFDVKYTPNIGVRSVYIAALKQGKVDLVPEYSGSILSYLNKDAVATSPSEVNAALQKALPSNLVALNAASAADSDSLNVTAAFAAKHNLTSIADLANVGAFSLTANPEFQTRPDGIPGLKSVYGLDQITFNAINDGGGPATVSALLNGSTQVADIYSTSPSISTNKFVTLADPKNLFASQQVVPLVLKKKATEKLSAVLNKVSAKLTTEDLLELNTLVSGDAKMQPDAAATQWLTKSGLLK